MRSFDLHGAADCPALRAARNTARPRRGPRSPRPCARRSPARSAARARSRRSAPRRRTGARTSPESARSRSRCRARPGPPAAPEIDPEPGPAPPPADPEPTKPPLEDPPPASPELVPPRDPEPRPEALDPHAALFEAIADFAGDTSPEIDARHGRIEITGVQVAPDSVLLAALDRAAQAAGAVLLTGVEASGVSWAVRLPRPEARHYLFVELERAQIAVPWSRVVEYGLASGGAGPRVLLGSGLERVVLPIDWLYGKGEGRPVHPPQGAREIAPPEAFAEGGWVRDPEGRIARVFDLARGAEPALAPEAGPPEAVQPEPIPADNPPESTPVPRSPLRALVADDSMMARVFLGRLLAQRGIVVEEAEDGAAARSRLAGGGFELVILDAEMPARGRARDPPGCGCGRRRARLRAGQGRRGAAPRRGVRRAAHPLQTVRRGRSAQRGGHFTSARRPRHLSAASRPAPRGS
jgi:CheY-like chemotaxis protein